MTRFVLIAATLLLIAGVWAFIVLRAPTNGLPAAPAPPASDTTPPGDDHVEAAAPSRAEAAPAPGASLPVVVADAATSISGHVVDHLGDPVAGADVMAYDANRGAKRTRSGEGGAFVIAGLDLPAYRVSARAEGFNDAVAEAVPRGRQALLLELSPKSVVEGVVVDARTNTPLRGFEVAYLPVAPGDARHWAVDVVTDRVPWVPVNNAQGLFRLEGIASDTPFAVAARAQGYEPAYVEAGPLAPAAATRDLRIALRAEGRIAGRVTNAGGRPVAAAGVHLGDDPDAAPLTHTGAEGRYELSGLVAGDTLVWARHETYVPVSRPVTIRAGQEHTVDLVLGWGVAITGHARFGGRPMEGLTIMVSSAQRDPMKKTATDREGAFRVEGLAVGELTVLALAAQWRGAAVTLPNAQQTIIVSGEGEVVVDFSFPSSTATMSGLVTVDGSVPVEGEVRGEMESGGSYTSFNAPLDESGAYHVADLLPGLATVTAQVTDAAGRSRRKLVDITIPEGGTVELDFALEGTASIHGHVSGFSRGEIGQVLVLDGVWTVEAPDLRALLELQSLQVAESPLDEAGRYDVSGLEAGTYTIVAMVARFSPDERMQDVRYVSETVTLRASEVVELALSP
jgi:hypothetical protein